MQMSYEKNSKIFKALSDANRLKILCLLSEGEKCACKLLDEFDFTQPTLSHHMKILIECGLVKCRKEGLWSHYSLDKENAEQLIGFLKNIFLETKSQKPKVAFICVHNSCRSQMAEALGKKFASDIMEVYSAGTELVPKINQDAVYVIKKLYGIDMNKDQYSKLIGDIPEVDIVIKMGCNVVCPVVYGKHIEDWGLEDPTGKEEEAFTHTAKLIEEKIKDLANRIQSEDIKWK